MEIDKEKDADRHFHLGSGRRLYQLMHERGRKFQLTATIRVRYTLALWRSYGTVPKSCETVVVVYLDIHFDMDTNQVISRHRFEEDFDVYNAMRDGESQFLNDDVIAFGPLPDLDINDDIKGYLEARYARWPKIPDKSGDLWAEG
ncbi:uncharacterized protein AB675_1253 [Cyphellophora attinorum]|uniref:Uncharacterized protein n=1 Tax=Cyphellophora attinorum TaxID=1664694 RepID=A0A0N0NIP8_9EURO|nr:uncharacterized protein AB675_1253 [Phialophora attinorum]KPI35699.1 hypothetical protein AB675_1253 [Phialophora attinorum]